MNSFHDEYDEFKWMCDRLKKKKYARRELRQIINLIIYDMSKLERRMTENGDLSRLEWAFYDRLVERIRRNWDELDDVLNEINELEYCIENEFNLGYVFNL